MKYAAAPFLFMIVFLVISSCVKDNLISTKAQFKLDTISVSSYLKQNNITAVKVQPGTWFVIDTLGIGAYPVLSDSVSVTYSTELLPGLNEVDQSTSPITVFLGGVIAGWQLALPNFPNGSYGRLFVPSGLAYGINSYHGIPPNANLMYRVKLRKIIGTQLTNDITAIGSYIALIQDSLLSNSITVKNDPSGLSYSINTTGPGPQPTLSDSVQVTYSGKILGADTLFVNVTSPVTLSMKNQVITGWKVILPLIPEGSTITMYVPSGFGYGSNVGPKIPVPANSNLIYQLNLIKVRP